MNINLGYRLIRVIKTTPLRQGRLAGEQGIGVGRVPARNRFPRVNSRVASTDLHRAFLGRDLLHLQRRRVGVSQATTFLYRHSSHSQLQRTQNNSFALSDNFSYSSTKAKNNG